ncbi:AAA family ATPase [Pseudanabaena sp. UWO311]|uniref:AAA family ATPase n=1 Tax=Pseudanabaena sp. UWO311 TaxID=2487337 RepID=UPI00115BE10D|nr:ATP-binding protein [Pseudanabaena sp. UWO311]TYQ25528.1 AAA family ATPase [Pseudanabaena sp. UWO311]
MLNRIYIDNFRSLVNFELSFDSINLFLGANGSGKSTVFEAIEAIKTLISKGIKVEKCFYMFDCCRWQISNTQNFEIEIDGNGGKYRYELVIQYNEQQKPFIANERLWFDSQPLLKFELGNAYIYDDDHSEVSKISNFDSSQSFLSFLSPTNTNKKLTWFRNRIDRLVVVQITPFAINGVSEQESFSITPRMENYVSWYRYLSQDQGKIFEITNVLKDILDGFVNFRFQKVSEANYGLKLIFENESDNKKVIEYYFNELSDGQKVIIALYTLIYGTQNEDYTLCIDEPENFLALPEVQPWLDRLYDFCSEKKLQAILISHHPKLINFLAADAGYWFERKGNSPVRVKRIKDEDDTGLPISDLVERGWLYDPE